MKKLTLTIAISIVSMLSSFAQENSISRSIRLSYGYLGNEAPIGYYIGNYTDSFSSSAFTLDADIWNLGHGFSLGGYLGAGPSSYEDKDNFIIPFVSARWGVGLHWHLFPTIGINSSKWDISLNANLGSYWSYKIAPQMDYSVNASVAFYLLTHWGIFVENGWGNMHFGKHNDPHMGTAKSILKVGVSYRF